MQFFKKSRSLITAIVLVLVITMTTACGTATSTEQTTDLPSTGYSQLYSSLERGNTTSGQQFGEWVVQTSRGLIEDAYVRDNDKLGVVISPKVEPTEVRPLTRSLVQGFHRNFPERNLTVLMYAPDKQLILTAQYNQQTNQIEYM